MADAEALLEPLIPALRRYAYALVRDHDAADDLVQDTLERALSRWALRRSDGDLRAWLFTIQRNLHVSSLRQGRRRGPHVELDEATTPVDRRAAGKRHRGAGHAGGTRPVAGGAEVAAAAGRASRIFHTTMRRRSWACRPGTVMSRLSRGRQRLRALLETGRATLLRRVK